MTTTVVYTVPQLHECYPGPRAAPVGTVVRCDDCGRLWVHKTNDAHRYWVRAGRAIRKAVALQERKTA